MLPQTTINADPPRPHYLAAGSTEYDLVNVLAGEWCNYTREFTNGNYRIHLRAQATTAQTVELRRVTNPTQESQTTVLLGNFDVIASSSHRFIPLTQPDGTPTVLSLSGVQTLRLMALTANNNLNLNYMLVTPAADAATVIGPYARSLSPAPDSTAAARNSVSATITSRETLLNTNSIALLVDGVPVTSGLTITPTPTGADVNYAVSPPFGPNSMHTVVLRFSDTIGNMFSNTWSFSTSPDALPIFTAPRIENGELKLLVAFAQPVDAATAGTLANYTSDQGVTFSGVALAGDRAVELTGTPIADGQTYNLTVRNVKDTLGNTVPDTSISYNASPFLQDAQDANGLLVLEAESYHTNSPGTDILAAQMWSFNTTFAGYSGGGAMLPNGGDVIVSNAPLAARMDYRVRFTQPGMYKLWIRGIEAGGGDAIYYGLNGTYVAEVTGIAVGSFNWNNAPEDAPTTGTNRFDIPSAGDYTISVSVSEDGMPLDRIVIVLESAAYNPASVNGGLGPPQSARVGDVVTPAQPVLQFSQPGPAQLRFDWTGTGFHLEQASDLGNPQWGNVPGGSASGVTVTLTNGPAFFRLSN
jgi:hypothetical protein